MSFISKALALMREGGLSTSTTEARSPRVGASYMRGGRGVVFDRWKVARRDPQTEIANAWDAASSRAFDAIVNSGWLTGAIEQAVANTVGTGLRLKAQPENEMFGMSNDAAQMWARQVENAWNLFASNPMECDITGKQTIGQMQAAAFRSWFATGEILVEFPWRKRSFNAYGTKVRLLQPFRLTRESNSINRLVNGVFLDADGMPISYRLKRKNEMGWEDNVDIPAFDRYGRRRIAHIFDGAPETYRGIGPLVSVLQVVRQFDQLADATLTSAIVQTLFAATITSDAPTEEVLAGMLTPQETARMQVEGVSPLEAYLDMSAGYYDSATLDTSINGRVGHLMPGDKMEFQSSKHPGPDFGNYAKMLLREFSRALGETYESATGDYSGSTYYTLGKSNDDIFNIRQVRRKNIVAPFCQPIYEGWLEEAIESGRIPFPQGNAVSGYQNFLLNRAAACRADWVGSPKPQADSLKAAKANEVKRRLGVVSDQMIAAEDGVDIEDVYVQRARERKLREKYGLPEPAMMGANGGPALPADADAPEDDAQDSEDQGDGTDD